MPVKQHVRLDADDLIEFRLPGGGGYGNPFERDSQSVFDDVVNGYVSIEEARAAYGVSITYVGRPDALVRPPTSYAIDDAETARLRHVG